jgi:hypothetical protein
MWRNAAGQENAGDEGPRAPRVRLDQSASEGHPPSKDQVLAVVADQFEEIRKLIGMQMRLEHRLNVNPRHLFER